jgi:hypothetical protein
VRKHGRMVEGDRPCAVAGASADLAETKRVGPTRDRNQSPIPFGLGPLTKAERPT